LIASAITIKSQSFSIRDENGIAMLKPYGQLDYGKIAIPIFVFGWFHSHNILSSTCGFKDGNIIYCRGGRISIMINFKRI
jgi:hypothetical protein